MQSGEIPGAEPAREGELSGDEAEEQSVRSDSSQESLKPKRKKPRHRKNKGLPLEVPESTEEVTEKVRSDSPREKVRKEHLPEKVPEKTVPEKVPLSRKTREIIEEAQGKRQEAHKSLMRPLESRKDRAMRELNEGISDMEGIRRSSRTRRPTERSADYESARAKVFRLAYRVSVQAALKSERAQETREAIRDEIMNMITYQVGRFVKWEDIPDNEKGNILQCFMFIKHKEKPDGSYDKTKARLVGDGSKQGEFMYDMISSAHTVALSSVFMMFNIASKYQCKLITFDIKGAFLHAKFTDKDVPTYIRVPKEVADIWI